MQKSSISILFIGLFLFLSTSCKTEFEKIRNNTDQKVLYDSAFKYYEAGEYLRAQTLFELIINTLRGKQESEKVYFYYAYTHYYLKKYVLASYYFSNFANTFPNSQFREEADFMNAYSNYKMSPSFRLDQTYTSKAIDGFQLFVNTYPSSERVEECNKLIDICRNKMEQKSLHEAELYFNLRQYQSATHSYENILRDFPESQDAERVRFMITKASYLLAENSVFLKQEDRFNETIENAERFIARYPNSEFDKEVKNILKDSNKQLKSVLSRSGK